MFKILLFALTVIPWTKGNLDIHHINTGVGNAAFFIFPDGTTMLFDAGEVDRNSSSRRSNPLKVAPATDSSAALCIKKYINKVLPGVDHIDYVVISHFHVDHYGAFSELVKYFKINKLIDRSYPAYDDVIKRSFDSVGVRKYITAQKGIKTEKLIVGRKDQIVANYPGFFVRNIKSGGDIWSGNGESTIKIIPDRLDPKDYNENPLCIALKISYGDFDYFTGGDMTGLQGFGLPTWFDTETPVAKVVGKVDALSLNHHGVRDATNEFFLKTLAPRVIIQQSWSSNHPGEEVLHRMISQSIYPGPRDIFATYVHEETKVTYGMWLRDNYKSTAGDILLRVSEGGKEFSVFVNDQKYGPFQSK
ncbi:MAG: MBL fold metallo-hydrolase [Bacteroidota bacterium]